MCRVRDFEVIELFPFGVSLDFQKDGEMTSNVVFQRKGTIPDVKVITFYR
jgi:hypothetical protein